MISQFMLPTLMVGRIAVEKDLSAAQVHNPRPWVSPERPIAHIEDGSVLGHRKRCLLAQASRRFTAPAFVLRHRTKSRRRNSITLARHHEEQKRRKCGRRV